MLSILETPFLLFGQSICAHRRVLFGTICLIIFGAHMDILLVIKVKILVHSK